jgi:hypothetical protein
LVFWLFWYSDLNLYCCFLIFWICCIFLFFGNFESASNLCSEIFF